MASQVACGCRVGQHRWHRFRHRGNAVDSALERPRPPALSRTKRMNVKSAQRGRGFMGFGGSPLPPHLWGSTHRRRGAGACPCPGPRVRVQGPSAPGTLWGRRWRKSPGARASDFNSGGFLRCLDRRVRCVQGSCQAPGKLRDTRLPPVWCGRAPSLWGDLADRGRGK